MVPEPIKHPVDFVAHELFPGQTGDMIEGAFDLGKSTVSKGMDILAKPLQIETGAVVNLLDKTVSPGIKKAINPTDSWAPDSGLHDILNYYTPTAKDLEKTLLNTGMPPLQASMVSDAYWGARTGLGLAMNFYGDPLIANNVAIGGLTKAAEEAYKVGDIANAADRNLVSLRLIGTDKPYYEGGSEVVGAIGRKLDELRARPLVGAPVRAMDSAASVANDLIQSFNPLTGYTDVDAARSEHSALLRGDRNAIAGFVKDNKAPNFDEKETAVLRNLIESTPNLAPEAAPHLGMASEDLSKEIGAALPKLAEKHGVQFAPERAEDLAQVAMNIKVENARDLTDRLAHGILDPLEAEKSVIQGYLSHQLTETARAKLGKAPELAAALEEASQAERLNKSLYSKSYSTYDPGQFSRKYQTTLDDANRILKEKTGITKWFVDDPVIATAMKRGDTRKLVRDKQLLEAIRQHAKTGDELFAGGRVLGNRMAKEGELIRDAKGVQHERINLPDFQGKKILIERGGKTISKDVEQLYFPKAIAHRINYDIAPRNGGSFARVNQFMDSYNRVFRNFALFKPDYYAENWIDNVLKNAVLRVKIEDYVDTARVLMEKEGTINVAGKEVPIQRIRDLMNQWDVRSGHFTEGLEKVLETGKRMAYEDTLAGRAKYAGAKGVEAAQNVLRGMHFVGERGENWTRQALFLSRIKQGYTPKMAAFEVEKFLFDFKRTTPAMDMVRRWYNPFIQAAFKTAFITPELLAKRPGTWNFYENQLMKTLQDSFNDPVTSAAVMRLYPSYFRLHDRIAGPLLNGNTLLALMAPFNAIGMKGNGFGESRAGLPIAIALGLPGGMGILNQFAVWDADVLKQNVAGSPVLRSFAIMLTGKDPWSGQQIDMSSKTANPAARFNAAVRAFVTSAIAVPNIEKMLMQRYGITDPQYMTPEAVLMLHGSMGKFARVMPLDREYLFRLMAFASAAKELKSTLASTFAHEAMGKTADIAFADKPVARSLVNAAVRPYSSAEVYSKLMDNVKLVQEQRIAAQILAGQMRPSSEEIVGLLKHVHQQIEDLNRNYVTLTNHYFQVAKGVRADQAAQFEQAIKADIDKRMAVPGDGGPAQ